MILSNLSSYFTFQIFTLGQSLILPHISDKISYRAKVNLRHLESCESGMKPVIVVQWVRGGSASSPIRSKSSRQGGSGLACVLERGCMEPGAASMKAV